MNMTPLPVAFQTLEAITMLQAGQGEARGLPAPLQLLRGHYQAQKLSTLIRLRGQREGTMGSGTCQGLTP